MISDVLVLFVRDLVACLAGGKHGLVSHAAHTDEVNLLATRRGSFYHCGFLNYFYFIDYNSKIKTNNSQ